MTEKVFLFDLDSTITREEILPTVALEIGKGDEMRALTESTMMGEIPFEESFTARVKMLKSVPVSAVSKRVAGIRLNERLVDFIREHKNNCYVVTSNLDVWIGGLMEKIGMTGKVFCSKARVKDDYIVGIDDILEKKDALKKINKKDTVAIGDGSNDYDFLKAAEIGVGFGGVRSVAPRLLEVCNYAVYTEEKLCELLNRIKDGHDKE